MITKPILELLYGIFEFLHRIVLTDVKPPIFHAMMKESGEKLNRWVLAQLHDTLKGYCRFCRSHGTKSLNT